MSCPLNLISTFDIVVEWISILSSKFLISLFKIDATVTQSSCYYYPRRPPCTFMRVWTYSRGRHSFLSPHVIPVFVDLIFWFTFLFMWYARGPRKKAMKEQFMNYLTLIADDPEGIYHSLFTHDFQLAASTSSWICLQWVNCLYHPYLISPLSNSSCDAVTMNFFFSYWARWWGS